ncbi:hypothetical protein TIFTF001_029424 [Ficus carica]|uniref:Uncharacterized protein n=1 Tax=Ficus carica TaxID=3494 RepID=A0AA88J2U6_FICCA|nr:hypothetical protein TIFTF001_029424 [Ficus carica]
MAVSGRARGWNHQLCDGLVNRTPHLVDRIDQELDKTNCPCPVNQTCRIGQPDRGKMAVGTLY